MYTPMCMLRWNTRARGTKNVQRPLGQIIQIIAVMHLRRHPDYWRGRVEYWKGGHTERSIV